MAELRKRGLLTAVVCSTQFERLGRTQARVLGVPEMPLLMITHPLGGISIEYVQARAEQAVAQFVDVIRGHLK